MYKHIRIVLEESTRDERAYVSDQRLDFQSRDVPNKVFRVRAYVSDC